MSHRHTAEVRELAEVGRRSVLSKALIDQAQATGREPARAHRLLNIHEIPGELDTDLAGDHLDQSDARKPGVAQLLTQPMQQAANARIGYVETGMQARVGPSEATVGTDLRGLRPEAANNRILLPAAALRVHELPGREEEY